MCHAALPERMSSEIGNEPIKSQRPGAAGKIKSARFLYLAPWLRSEPRESRVAGLLAGIAANAHERESALLSVCESTPRTKRQESTLCRSNFPNAIP